MKKKQFTPIYQFTFAIILILFANSCDTNDFKTDTFTDPRDGNVYKTVTIGTQTWMAENLRYLPAVVGPLRQSQYTTYHYVYGYGGTDVEEAKATVNYQTYGVLYNWAAAKAACPAGWHLPTDAEWTQLTEYLGESDAGGKLKEKGTKHWNSPNTGATNKSNFSALPGGGRFSTFTYNYLGDTGFWWTDSEDGSGLYYYRYIHQNDKAVIRGYVIRDAGFSVRCVKD
jgi:uncharacterized protein (TIGR02145 family)